MVVLGLMCARVKINKVPVDKRLCCKMSINTCKLRQYCIMVIDNLLSRRKRENVLNLRAETLCIKEIIQDWDRNFQ